MSRYRCRKGFIATNLLAACLFNLRFCYILAGWEGSAADSRLFDEAVVIPLKSSQELIILLTLAFLYVMH